MWWVPGRLAPSPNPKPHSKRRKYSNDLYRLPSSPFLRLFSCGTLDRSRQITEQLPGSVGRPWERSLLSFRNECRLAFVHLFLPFTVLLSFVPCSARLTFSKSPARALEEMKVPVGSIMPDHWMKMRTWDPPTFILWMFEALFSQVVLQNAIDLIQIERDIYKLFK